MVKVSPVILMHPKEIGDGYQIYEVDIKGMGVYEVSFSGNGVFVKPESHKPLVQFLRGAVIIS